MPQYKRFPFVFFQLVEDELLDVAALVRGEYKTSRETTLFVESPLTASKYAIKSSEIDLLLKIPSDRWVAEEELCQAGAERGWLENMARNGVLLTDRDEPLLGELRRRASVLISEEWHPYSALYHFMTRREESRPPTDYVLAEAEAEERARKFVSEHGPPPSPFHVIPESKTLDLPLSNRRGEIYDLLKRRRSSRAFDLEKKTSLSDLVTLLQYTFGCHGYLQLAPDVLLIHRTSPSGGSRHPVEVYPLVMQVDDLDVGLYHYNTHCHSLELIQSYTEEQARGVARKIASGQEYAGSAHVLFIMTARFYRNHWKYRRRSRTYSVILMDIAHLSQTLHLIATDLNLGIFFSAAVDGRATDEILGIDGYTEGSIAVCGCGVKAGSDTRDLSLKFLPFIPRKTSIP